MKTEHQIRASMSERFKQYRKTNHLRQEDLAYILSVSRATLGSYEERRAMPPLSVMMEFARLADTTLDELVK